MLAGGLAVYPNNNIYSAVLCSILYLFSYYSRPGIIVVFNSSCSMTTVKYVIWFSIKDFFSASVAEKYSKRAGVGYSLLETFVLGCRNFLCLWKSTLHITSV